MCVERLIPFLHKYLSDYYIFMEFYITYMLREVIKLSTKKPWKCLKIKELHGHFSFFNLTQVFIFNNLKAEWGQTLKWKHLSNLCIKKKKRKNISNVRAHITKKVILILLITFQ